MGTLRTFWSKVHPKIQAVAIGSALVAIAQILNAYVAVYPDGWATPIVAVAAVTILGWSKRA